MAVTAQSAYLVLLSIGDKTYIIHPIICLLDTEEGPNLIRKDVAPAHWLLEMVELTTM